MGSKTPVSILQEMMARLGTPPKYDLILDGSGTHTALFKYKVYASNVTAIGTGRSKKEAKHEAARIALERLAQHQIADAQPSGVPPKPTVEVVTPYKDKIQDNAVGALYVMCSTHEIPLPEYDQIEEKGAPHEKIFTIVCSVSKQKETGTGRTKKQAKQLAAFNMMNRLKESLSEVLKDAEEEEAQQPRSDVISAGKKYIEAVGTPSKKIRLNRSVASYHLFFPDSNSEIVQRARDVLCKMQFPTDVEKEDNVPEDKDSDWVEILKEVLKILEMKMKIILTREGNNGKQNVFIQTALIVDAVFYGSAYDWEEAVKNAAVSALLFLKKQICEGVPNIGIVSVPKESDDSSSEMEIVQNNETVSHSGALQCVEALLDYMRQQEFAYGDITALRKIHISIQKLMDKQMQKTSHYFWS